MRWGEAGRAFIIVLTFAAAWPTSGIYTGHTEVIVGDSNGRNAFCHFRCSLLLICSRPLEQTVCEYG